MTEIYILLIVLWVVGGLYTCGLHYSNCKTILDIGSEEDIKQLNDKKANSFVAYLSIFLLWPAVLGAVNG